MASNDWERHKATILNLFLLENKQLDEIVSYMKETHKFNRSKSSYENQINKKWRVRKNVSKKEWQYLGHQISKRKEKKTVVTVYGIPLSEEKVHKELQRHTTNIPSASEFRNGLLSPDIPEGIVARAETPPVIELDVSWPSSLPWFRFKNGVLPKLRYPSRFLRAFFDSPIQYEEGVNTASPCVAWRNTLELRQAVIRLSNTVPDDSEDRQRKAEALARNEFPPYLVTEMLKIIFFRLSNSMDTNYHDKNQTTHDQFVLHLVEAVSQSNPEVLSALFFSDCTTTKAIKEGVYGSAIREKHYDLVEKLLQSGVDPNLPVKATRYPSRAFRRGTIQLVWSMSLDTVTGMQEAVLTRDVRLGEVLLSAGANVSDNLLVELATCASKYDDAMEFVQLLVKYGATVNALATCCRCGGARVALTFAIAIASKINRLTEFLIEKGAIADLSGYSEPKMCLYCRRIWYNEELSNLRVPYTPIQIAIILGNREMIERLLQPILSCPTQTSLHTIKDLLLSSCLVGDTDTALKLLKLEDIDIDLNSGWYKGITPLVASAWNSDTRIAEALLDLGAKVGPTLQENVCQVSTLCPIHVAAFHGNVSLLEQLISRGANYNVRHVSEYDYRLWCLAPDRLSCPLQFALESKSADTVRFLLTHLNLLGDGLDDSAFISKVISKEPNVGADEDKYDKTAFGAAIKVGSAEIIQYYFSIGAPYTSQALHLATKAAVKSKDYSILNLLVEHRPVVKMDSFEVSSLVLSIVKRQWELVSLFLCEPFLPGDAKSFYNDYHFHDLLWPEKILDAYISWSEKFPNESGYGITPLLAAALSGNIPIVERMIERGFIPQETDAVAFMEGKLEKQKILDTVRTVVLSKFPLPSMDIKYRAAVLEHAIQSGDLEKVREYSTVFESFDICLLNDGQYQWSPLALAADHGHIELVRFFLDAGAKPDFTLPFDGRSALEAAALRGYLNIVEHLLSWRNVANLSFRRWKTTKALNLAAAAGHLHIARLLIEEGADINEAPWSFSDMTVLEAAADNGRLDMIQLLLERGARLEKDMRLYYVQSVRAAMKQGHHAIADRLKQCGSWGEMDQHLHDILGTLVRSETKVWYDKDTDIWRIQKWKDKVVEIGPFPRMRQTEDDRGSVASLGDGSSNKDDISHDGVEVSLEIMRQHHETRSILPTQWTGMGHTSTELSGVDFANEKAEIHGLAPSLGLERNAIVMELEGIPETGDVLQLIALLNSQKTDFAVPTVSTDHPIANTSMRECYLVDRMDVDQTPELPRLDREGAGGQNMSPNFVDREWQAIISACQPNDAWCFPDMDIADGQSIVPDSGDVGWEGPFTNWENELFE
ncbi:ankyrin repeat-containing domain protein [Xylaria cubensis]|nr:ankyrin repeat-containing domain protein [Xylaria cubensis]